MSEYFPKLKSLGIYAQFELDLSNYTGLQEKCFRNKSSKFSWFKSLIKKK